jgi:uncharacterized protein (TIRG00374 family)
LAFLLAGGAAWLSIRQVRWQVLKEALADPHLALLALALLTVLLTTAAKAARWHVLLRASEGRVGTGRVTRVLLVGQMANSLMPRMGDLVRSVLIAPHVSGGVLAVLGTIVAEKALDGILGLLVLVGLAVWMPLPAWLRGPALALSALTGSLLLLLVLAADRGNRANRLMGWLAARLPSTVRARVARSLAGIDLGLGLFRRPANASLALALSVVVWGLALSTNVATLAALGIEAPGWSAWLVLVAGYVAVFLPTVPAQIGVFEYACVLSLTVAAVEPEPALAFGLVLHLLVFAPPAVLGPVCMAVEGLSWSGVQAARRDHIRQDHVPR